MSVTSPESTHYREYRLANQDADVEIKLILKPHNGDGLRLYWRRGEDEDGFQSQEIENVHSAGELRCRAVRYVQGQPGDPGVDFWLEVVVPVVEFGTDPADQGPFDVYAAGLRIENLRASGDAGPGPREAIEAFSLTGKAYLDTPPED